MGESHDEAFSDFVAERGPSLLRTAYLLVGSRPDAEDLLQTVLARTYVAWPRLRELQAADAYVRVALGRTAITWWRRRNMREFLVSEMPESSAPPADDHADRDEMWTCLAGLPPRQRAVLVLRYYESMSESEIASALRCSRGTVKSQASKALRTLRRRWPAMTEITTGEEVS